MFFDKLKQSLAKTKEAFSDGVNSVFSVFTKVDENFLEELEEVLIMSDVGMVTAEEIINRLRDRIKKGRIEDAALVKEELKKVLEEILLEGTDENDLDADIILVVGVNGVGKTTSLGKIANYYVKKGKKVIACAADTFRAAAVEQLEIWCERSKIDLVKKEEGADPAAVVYDAIQMAQAKKSDLLICDTAGRLHNKKNLMDELAKINRIVDKSMPNAKKEVLLVLDATTGQNGINQAKAFSEATGVTGIVITKLDGTAKGGMIFSVKMELNIPVRFIGVGEGIDDFEKFNAKEFVESLFA
ncbi:MAG: signal recognition particle-docking protein FtsY [Clostridia bacterium]|nr:signal recognition particle-docking protein FtsY [Clostridia bacterium]